MNSIRFLKVCLFFKKENIIAIKAVQFFYSFVIRKAQTEIILKGKMVNKVDLRQ